MSKIRAVTARMFAVPLPEVLTDAKHGDHTDFQLETATVTLDDGSEGTGYTSTGDAPPLTPGLWRSGRGLGEKANACQFHPHLAEAAVVFEFVGVAVFPTPQGGGAFVDLDSD